MPERASADAANAVGEFTYLCSDNRLDIASAIYTSSTNPDRGSVAVTLQDSSGNTTFLPPVEYVVEQAFQVNSIEVSDVNADDQPDKLPDIILANAFDGIYVFYQDTSGDGSFSSAVKIGE